MCRKKWIKTSLFAVCVGFFFSMVTGSALPASNYDKTDNTSSQIKTIQTIHGTIKNGETISSLLDPYMPLKQIYKFSKKKIEGFSLTRIKKDQPYQLTIKGQQLVRFEYEIDIHDRLILQKNTDGFSMIVAPIDYDTQQETVSGVITNSLFNAVIKAGEKTELAIRLADIFAWDIDFINDIRPGDHFKLVVQKRYRNGRFCGYGQIQAAFFTNRDRLFKAFLFEDSNGSSGYFDENGQSLQKAFLKAPLTFSRISSKFSKRRLHPIFKEYRPHPGVDYAAPKGTPIKTVGDGIVVRKGYNKGMGNFIEVRHYNGYTTSYNHMSAFAQGMTINKRLIQGDVIGYVGMTGYATGPHLDFRMKKNGTLIDPLTHRVPSAKPVPKNDMPVFLAITQKLSDIILTAQMRVSSVKKPT
jgi:murein DD-endopeptidase MepM/ murein hydrolase activator NlpD